MSYKPVIGVQGAPGAVAVNDADETATDACSARVDFARTAAAWTASGNLNVGRFGAGRALLANGHVLVCGGFNAALAASASAETYDPITGLWTATAGPMGTARGVPTATLLPDGRVLVIGGYANLLAPPSAIGTAEIYDPATGLFSAAAAPAAAHGGHQAVLLSSGLVLAVGGSVSFTGAAIANCDLYDPATNSWAATGALNAARGGLTATVMPDGRVLAAGGSDPYPVGMISCEVYNPDAGTWAVTDSLATARTIHGAMLLTDGRVLVAGGVVSAGVATATCEVFSPLLGTWAGTGALSVVRGALSGCVIMLPNGRVVVIGGADNPGVAYNSTEVYTSATGLWAAGDNLTESRFLAATALLPNGQILTAGGAAALPGAVRNSSNLYDPFVPSLTTTSGVASVAALGIGFYRLTLTPAALASWQAGGRHVYAEPASYAQPYDRSAQIQKAQVVRTDLTAGTIDVQVSTNPVGIGPSALPFAFWIR